MYEEIKLKIDKRDAANKHRVPKKQWRKWSLLARKVFNELYSAMVLNKELFLHPHQKKLTNRMWKTTAWNAAWIAADATR